MNEKQLESNRGLVFSYLTLRKVIGLLGIALPLVVSLGAFILDRTGIQDSISSYYYTGTRDLLVGVLWAIGFFLLSYKGYERVDDLAGDLACVFAIGTALFPTAPDSNPSDQARWIGYVHLTFATLFFLTLIYFSLCLFTKTDQTKPPTKKKLQRNTVYRVCGYAMAGCIGLIALYYFADGEAGSLERYAPVFWLETIAIWAFGVSWLTKGEAILSDEVNS